MNSLKLKMNDLGADSVKKAIDDKIPDVLSFFQNIFGLFINWLDDVFPPGTRMETLKNWILLAAPYAILGLVLLICLPCIFSLIMGIVNCFLSILRGIWNSCFFYIPREICRCLFYVLKGIWRCLCINLCCCCAGGRKMMIAPGRNVRISRMSFEANPADYFRGLHAGLPLSGDYLA